MFILVISPFVCRLGLGAELSVKSAQPRIVTDNKVCQSVSGKRKPCLPSKSTLEGTCTRTNNVIGMYLSQA